MARRGTWAAVVFGMAIAAVMFFFGPCRAGLQHTDHHDEKDTLTELRVQATENHVVDNADLPKTHNKAMAGFFSLSTAGVNSSVSLIEAQKRFAKYCTTSTGTCEKQQRFGITGDGGYEVCMDEPLAPQRNNCIIYSFGIGALWSFDDESQRYGCEVHSFDPSIHLQDHTRAPNHHFHNLGLWDADMTNADGWNLATLDTIMHKLGHVEKVIDVLKVDIEGAEWPFLHQILLTSGLRRVKQLIFELHAPTFTGTPMTAADFLTVLRDLDALQATQGFRLYRNLHDNGCCGRFAVLTPPGIIGTRTLCCYELYFIHPMI